MFNYISSGSAIQVKTFINHKNSAMNMKKKNNINPEGEKQCKQSENCTEQNETKKHGSNGNKITINTAYVDYHHR